MTTQRVISIDIGATKCAAAIVDHQIGTDQFRVVATTQSLLTDHRSCLALFECLQERLQFDFSRALAINIAAAGQYDGKELVLARGYPYPMTLATTSAALGWKNIAVVHDYVPNACATFTTHSQDPRHVRILNPGKPQALGRRVVFGIGTGLGLKDAFATPNGDFCLGENEAGHIGIAIPNVAESPYLKQHQALMDYLKKKQLTEPDRSVSFETVLSGKGILRLHHFLSAETTPRIEGVSPSELQLHPDTWRLFAWYLGVFVATVQLMLLPRGGIWISGGVIQRRLELFDYPEFSAGIAQAPAYQALRAEIPLLVMKGIDHIFHGGAYYAVKRQL